MISSTKSLAALICLSSVLSLSIQNNANADIIAVLTESSANGFVGLDGSEDFEGDPISLDSPRINASFGNRAFGSASRFDSISDLDGEKILFMNGNSTLGFDGSANSRTVVDVSFQNTTNEAIRPVLQSQILAAGMGFFMSECSGENILECASSNNPAEGFQSINGALTDFGEVFSSFDFRIEAGDQVLYSLSASVLLNVQAGVNTIQTNFGEIENVLNDFRQTSLVDSIHELTFDWGATDFEVMFPIELTLDPGEVGSVRYITEVSTSVIASCSSSSACPVAYSGFGDPIGRGDGGGGLRRPRVLGIEPSLYELEASFDNNIVSILATSGPGISDTPDPEPQPVPSPAPLVLLAMSISYLFVRRETKLLN